MAALQNDGEEDNAELLALQRIDETCTNFQQNGQYLEALECMERGLVLRQHFFGAGSDEVWRACKTVGEMCNLLAMTYLQQEDFAMVLASMGFVGLYIGYHTGSLFLALLGLLQILLSLPLALFFYTLLRVTWFSQVHILSVFVVLGVGAFAAAAVEQGVLHGEDIPIVFDIGFQMLTWMSLAWSLQHDLLGPRAIALLGLAFAFVGNLMIAAAARSPDAALALHAAFCAARVARVPGAGRMRRLLSGSLVINSVWCATGAAVWAQPGFDADASRRWADPEEIDLMPEDVRERGHRTPPHMPHAHLSASPQPQTPSCQKHTVPHKGSASV